MTPCLDDRLALDYLTDSATAEAARAAEDHVEACPRCQDLLERLADSGIGDKIVRALAVAPPLPSSLERLLAAGTRDDDELGGPPSAPTFPGYELLRELGRGGAGVVYLARDDAIGRHVALKVILTGRHASPDELARFRSEAALVSRIRHPNLVRVHHVGERDGLPFCAMEYVDGGSLRRRLSAGPMPHREAAALVAKLADAVAAVHAAGVVHRDLKPENVLLTADGEPRVADFGLARDLNDEGRPALTRTSQVIGTPRYMAPEQAAGRDERNGPAVDVHGLGVILYEALTGSPPFVAATLAQTLAQVVAREPVPPQRLAPGLPLDLATVCLKCLQKEPSQRYPTANALADDLRRFLDDRPVQARPVGPVQRLARAARRRPLVAGLAGALTSVVLAMAVGGPVAAARLSRLAADLRAANDGLTAAKAVADANAADALAKTELAQATIADTLGLIDRDLDRNLSVTVVRALVMERVVDLQKRFAEGEGAGAAERFRVAESRLQYAEALIDLDQNARGEAQLAEALALLDGLIAASPARAEYRAAAARARGLQGRAWLALRKPEQAGPALAESAAAFGRLFEDEGGLSGAPVAHRLSLALALGRLARFEAERGRAEPADAAAVRCRALCLADDNGAHGLTTLLHMPAEALDHCAAAALGLGRPAQAERDARAALYFAEGLWRNYPFNPHARRLMASANLRLALAIKAREPDRAGRLARGSLEVASRLVDDRPGDAPAMRLEGEARNFLEASLRAAGQTEQADAHRREAREAKTRRAGWPGDWPPIGYTPLHSLLNE